MICPNSKRAPLWLLFGCLCACSFGCSNDQGAKSSSATSSGGSGGGASGGTGGTDAGGSGGSNGSSASSSGGSGGTGGGSGGTGTGGGGTGATGGAGGSGGGAGSGGDASGGSGGAAGEAGAPGDGGSGGGTSCDDDDPSSEDFVDDRFGCAHRFDANPEDDESWTQYDAGFGIDNQTGLAWVSLSPGSRNLETAEQLCGALELAGLGDWRVPTIDEARSLAAGCAATEPGGSCALSDPECLNTSCGTDADCGSCQGGAGPRDGAYCKVDAAICTHYHTSSECNDCTGENWIYGTSNGNFSTIEVTALIPTVCVSDSPG